MMEVKDRRTIEPSGKVELQELAGKITLTSFGTSVIKSSEEGHLIIIGQLFPCPIIGGISASPIMSTVGWLKLNVCSFSALDFSPRLPQRQLLPLKDAVGVTSAVDLRPFIGRNEELKEETALELVAELMFHMGAGLIEGSVAHNPLKKLGRCLSKTALL